MIYCFNNNKQNHTPLQILLLTPECVRDPDKNTAESHMLAFSHSEVLAYPFIATLTKASSQILKMPTKAMKVTKNPSTHVDAYLLLKELRQANSYVYGSKVLHKIIGK